MRCQWAFRCLRAGAVVGGRARIRRTAHWTSSVLNKVAAMKPARREPRVVILGGGSWGTTVAPMAARRADTLQWVRSAETADDINERHRNVRYLGDEVELQSSLKATTDFEQAADCADVVVMAVPSHSFRDVLIDLSASLRSWVPIISLVKGLA